MDPRADKKPLMKFLGTEDNLLENAATGHFLGSLVLASENESKLLSRSHELDPADCTDQQICHIIAATT